MWTRELLREHRRSRMEIHSYRHWGREGKERRGEEEGRGKGEESRRGGEGRGRGRRGGGGGREMRM